MLAMLLLPLSLSIILPSHSASASTTGSSSSQGVATLLSGTWVQVSSSDNITMSVVPMAGDGSLVASKGTVNVKSNSTSGYQLYIAGTLYHTNNNDNRYAGLYLDGSTTGGSNAMINAVPTTSTPTSLGINEWGYALPGSDGFSNQSLYDSAISAESITTGSTMDALTWRGLTADYIHLRTSTNDNSDSSLETTGENTDIYYGVRINNTLSNGNYRNTIVYTAFIDGSSAIVMDPVRLDLTAADAGTNTTVNVLFKTGHESSSQPVTPSQIEVSLFDSANASADIASCEASTITIQADHDGTYGHPLWFTCDVKRLSGAISSATPNYDVIVKVDSENTGIYTIYEEQDYWRFITTWNYSLTFNNNGATSGSLGNQTGSKLETESFEYTLPANPTKTNYTFANWTDGTNTYTAGGKITLTKSNPSKALTAVWNEIPVTYTLSYSAGDHAFSNASSFSNQTATQNMSAGTSYTFTISSTTPTTTDDYTFDHWTDGTKSYNPGASITLTSASNTVTLTAVWKANRLYMQDASTAAACKALATNGTMVAYDRRDEKGYLIGKLADGKCWMLQNLALEGGTTITSTNSNVSSNYTLPSSSTSGWSSDTAQYMYNGTHTTDGGVDNTTNNTGAYYSFLVATAGTGTGSSGNVSYSICPSGWRLPTSTSSGEFQALYTATGGSASAFNTAFKVAFTGICLSSSCPASVGSYVSYWSSTIYRSMSGYYLGTNSGSTLPSVDSNKRNGFPVRCVLAS